jgi:hypothetical protein
MTTVKQEKTLLDEFDKRYGKLKSVEVAYMLGGLMLDERQRYQVNQEIHN